MACGPGGITGLLSEREGSKGYVVGLETNADFLEYASATAAANTGSLLGDAYEIGVLSGNF